MHSLVSAGTVPSGDRLPVRRAGCVAAGFLLLGPIEILTLLGKWSLAMAITEPTRSVPVCLTAPAQAGLQSAANAMDFGGMVGDCPPWGCSDPRRLVADFHRVNRGSSLDVSIWLSKTIVNQVLALCVEKFNAFLPES